MVEASHERSTRIACRAANLIPFWDTSAPIPQRRPLRRAEHRYVIVDASAVRGHRARRAGSTATIISSFGSLELAQAFAQDEIQYGNPNVVIIDRQTGKRVFP